jgi:integrase
VRWSDVDLDGPQPSLLVARGKPRRQPVPSQLTVELERLRGERERLPEKPVFRGLGGKWLQPTASPARSAAVLAAPG